MAAAEADPVDEALCIVLECWDAADAGSQEVAPASARVVGLRMYPDMALSLWMQQVLSLRLDCVNKRVAILGRAPLSLMIVLGKRLYFARRVHVGPFDFRPSMPDLRDPPPFGVRSMKVSSRGEGKGPALLYFTIKGQNRARFEHLPPDLNVKHILTVTPCDEDDITLTPENQEVVIAQSAGILREALHSSNDLTEPHQTVYVATSAPAILAVLLGALLHHSPPRRFVSVLERSHADGMYSVATPLHNLPSLSG